MFLKRGRDKLVRDVEKRIADFTFIPVGMRFKIIPMYTFRFVFLLTYSEKKKHLFIPFLFDLLICSPMIK